MDIREHSGEVELEDVGKAKGKEHKGNYRPRVDTTGSGDVDIG